MKKIVLINIFLLVYLETVICAEDTPQNSNSTQNSVAVKTDSTSFFRKEKPFFFFMGLDGLGIGGTVHGIVEIQISSLLIEYHAKAKVFIMRQNSSPLIGIGIGKGGHEGTGGENTWSVVMLGWQFHPYGKKDFYEITLQYPLHETNKKALFPFLISISAGVRIF